VNYLDSESAVQRNKILSRGEIRPGGSKRFPVGEGNGVVISRVNSGSRTFMRIRAALGTMCRIEFVCRATE
jgi:hypothetical protein